MAEPEAAADAQYVSAYGNYGAYGAYGAYPYTHNLPLTTYNHAAAPLTTYAASPLTTYAASPLVRSFTHGLYNRHIIAKREAEAEADPALIYGSYAAAPYARYGHFSHVAAPFVRTVAAPVVRTVAAPLTTYNYNHVVSPVVRALASHTVTSYNSPTHYTAVSNGVYGPSYVAKNGAVQHIVKREADAEADPAFVYNTVPTYATSNVVAPLTSTYAVASPLTTTYNHIATPLTTYSHVAAPLTTTYNHVAAPLTTTYNNLAAHVVASPVTYAHIASNGAHAVAATPMGWTHSANVGVCTNVSGQQVAC